MLLLPATSAQAVLAVGPGAAAQLLLKVAAAGQSCVAVSPAVRHTRCKRVPESGWVILIASYMRGVPE